MKKQMLIAMTAAAISFGATFAQAGDELAPPSISLGNAVVDLAPEGSTAMTADELADTRGEAVLVWKKKCVFWKACTFVPTVKYVRYTSKNSRTGHSYTYTRNH